MARISSMKETLAQNQSPPLLFTDKEQADVLRARLQADREKATAELANGNNTTADWEEFDSGSDAETRNPRNRRDALMRQPVAHTEGVRPPVVRAGGSGPAADVEEDSSQTRFVFDRLGPLSREPARHAPAQPRVHIRDAQSPVIDRLHDVSASTATSRQT